MKLIKRILSLSLVFISIGIIYYSPIYIVGEYPMFMGFISSLVILISAIVFLKSFAIDNKLTKPLTTLFITVLIVGGLGIIPGFIFTGIHFKKAKSSYLIEKGVISKALITNKEYARMSRRGNESETFQIYFKFRTYENRIISAFEIVSKEEYALINKGDSALIIYSSEKPKIVDLVLDSNALETYKAKIIDDNK